MTEETAKDQSQEEATTTKPTSPARETEAGTAEVGATDAVEVVAGDDDEVESPSDENARTLTDTQMRQASTSSTAVAAAVTSAAAYSSGKPSSQHIEVFQGQYLTLIRHITRNINFVIINDPLYYV